jgi:hypothetical protein
MSLPTELRIIAPFKLRSVSRTTLLASLLSPAALRLAWSRLVFAAALLLGASLSAQLAANPPDVSPNARLMAARSIYIEHSGGSLPNDVIGDAFQGWGRYQLVGDPAQADLIVSIGAPASSDSGVTVGGGGRHGSGGGRTVSPPEVNQIRLLILDAHDRVVLWSGSEQPKSALKEKQREDHLVEASLRLFRRFRNLIEPEPEPAP